MKLWLLAPTGEQAREGEYHASPWRGYDIAEGFVIRAETEAEARELADANGGDEVRFKLYHSGREFRPWLNSELSSCVELTADGDRGIVLRDFCNG